jgi:hypothetical protein
MARPPPPCAKVTVADRTRVAAVDRLAAVDEAVTGAAAVLGDVDEEAEGAGMVLVGIAVECAVPFMAFMSILRRFAADL